ncbi:hypothetical protein IWX87_000088 [Polaromonas sp. CG_9.7]|nr:hypothetical protein [Polaromonas sp. CG_9.7]MBG6112346.1 hypothetical protein [Polaromonas sp. CG_9.2]MDH6183992.1 hypothetical protein [Polaromonas sp. CG_23.6]
MAWILAFVPIGMGWNFVSAPLWMTMAWLFLLHCPAPGCAAWCLAATALEAVKGSSGSLDQAASRMRDT